VCQRREAGWPARPTRRGYCIGEKRVFAWQHDARIPPLRGRIKQRRYNAFGRLNYFVGAAEVGFRATSCSGNLSVRFAMTDSEGNRTMVDKVILITGGGRGIRGACSLLAAQRGYKVCVTYRTDAAAALNVVAETKLNMENS
jgi:hypothetical protein